MTPDVQLLAALHQLRRQWRQRQLVEGIAAIVLGVAIAVAVGWLLFRVMGPGETTVSTVRIAAWTIMLATVGRFFVYPLLRRTSDERFALYVEERAPELRQSLISAVHEVTRPVEERASSSLTARLAAQVVSTLTPIQRERRLERKPSQRALQTMGVVGAASALLLVFGPSSVRDMAKLLFVPWTTAEAASVVRAVTVEPGDATVPRGGALDVRAALVNFDADGAELFFRADSSTEWIRLPMQREGGLDSLGQGDGAFMSRMFDVTSQTEYYVESDGVRSPVYTLKVSDLPAVRSITLELTYPAYTGLPPERIESSGDVAAVVGTRVRVIPEITRDVRSGALRFDEGDPIPFVADSAGAWSGSFRVTKTGFYRVDLVSQDGRDVPGGVQYAVDAIPDRAPTVRIEEPGRDTKVTSLEEVTIAAQADDDFGVTSMELRYRVNGGEEQRVSIMQTARRDADEISAAHTLFLEEQTLEPGDLSRINVVARDGAGNEGTSDVYFLEVRPFSRNYRQADTGWRRWWRRWWWRRVAGRLCVASARDRRRHVQLAA